jgi:hypothetical protein
MACSKTLTGDDVQFLCRNTGFYVTLTLVFVRLPLPTAVMSPAFRGDGNDRQRQLGKLLGPF